MRPDELQPTAAETATGLTDAMRERLRAIADVLIPAAHGMPSAGEVGVADRQLDRVLAARPDLTEPLGRALSGETDEAPEDVLRRLQDADPVANDALIMAVVGGYYTHPAVRKALKYDGQVPVLVRPEIIPNYVEEGLIDPVLERGSIYRPVPEEEES